MKPKTSAALLICRRPTALGFFGHFLCYGHPAIFLESSKGHPKTSFLPKFIEKHTAAPRQQIESPLGYRFDLVDRGSLKSLRLERFVVEHLGRIADDAYDEQPLLEGIFTGSPYLALSFALK